MPTLSLIWGILAVIGMAIGFIPCVGWLNWLNIPFAAVGLVLSIVAVATARGSRGSAVLGLILCASAVCFGAVRLLLGGGVL